MGKGVKSALYLSTCSLVLSGYLALTATQDYDATITLVPVLMFMLVPLAEWLDERFPGYRRVTTAITYAYTVMIPLTWLAYGLFPTVVALVIFIQAYKLLHRKNEQDYQHIFLMSFFLLVAASVLSPDASIAIAFVAFLVSSVGAFFALQIHTETARCKSPPESDVVPLGMQRPTYTVRREHFLNGGLVASYLAITAACLLMTGVFFVTTPRTQAGVFGGASLQPIRQFTGLAESVDLSKGGPREINTAPVMRVYTPDEPGGHYQGPLYWRNTSFDRFNGTGWDSTSESAEMNDGRPDMRFSIGTNRIERNSFSRKSRGVKQVIYLDKIPTKGLPAIPWPYEVRWNDARVVWDTTKGDTTIDVLAARRDSLFYEVISEIETATPDELRQASGDYQGMFDGRPLMTKALYERLTYQNLSEAAVELARQITRDQDNPYDKAVAIERYLSQGDYFYALGAPMNEVNPVDSFILVTRAGHCELFASAMALMLRSIGIPARVANGYRGGDWDENDRSFTVRSSMAHLWVEVYFIGYGWQQFDPSPPDALASENTKMDLKQYLYNKLLKGKMLWYQDVVGYTAWSPTASLRSFTLGILKGLSLSWLEATPERKGGPVSRKAMSPDTIAWLLLAGLGLLALHALRRGRKEREGRRAGVLSRDQLRAVRLFKRVRRKVRRSIPEWEGKTAEELLRMLVNADASTAAAVRDLLDAYSEVRFGGRPLPRAKYVELQKTLRTLDI